MRRNSLNKKIAIVMAFLIFFQVSFPAVSLALTSGPSQPEVQSFEPVGTTEMVDLFSGDFNYNIPLLDVGGYPINIAYHAGVGMEQEASWVGLGWNLNAGSVNRNMRGIPDDFSGDLIRKEVHRKKNESVSFLAKANVEAFGLPKGLSLGVGIKHNSYKGLSVLGSANINLDIIDMGAFSLNTSLGVDLENGISITPSLSSNYQISKKKNVIGNINIGAPYNSREGLTELTFSKSFAKSSFYDSKNVYLGNQSNPINSSLVNFNTPSYITKSDFNSNSLAFSLELNPGLEIPFINGSASILGSYSSHNIHGNQKFNAYGYNNQHLANPRRDLLDFNREKDGPFFEGSGVLPLTNLTNDVFSITGQGMGGAFRSFRNQLSYVTDPSVYNTSDAASVGVDIGVPASPITFKSGANVSIQELESKAGIWSKDNLAISKYKQTSEPSDPIDKKLFEKSYFKQIGELSSDRDRFENLGGFEPLAFDINKHVLNANLKNGSQVIKEVQDKRAFRNQMTYAKTFRDAYFENTDKEIYNYKVGLDINGALEKDSFDILHYMDTLEISSNQIFEYAVLRPDGMRYIYGQPTFNIVQEETIFNTDSLEAGRDNIVEYEAAELLPSTPKGIDDFVSREILPAYTYSHLLTEVLSPDYSDLTGDGPSDDDYGTWVKMNYNCTAGPLSEDRDNYNWRLPYRKNPGNKGIANFNEGFKSNQFDNKANYTYGEKELWYLQSIESRTHIALFYTSERHDAKGVDNNLGTTNHSAAEDKNKKLDRIEYFAKNDLAEEGSSAIPLKTVHFEYDYTLCKGVENNFDTTDTGKLTLKKLYFTYGSSKKGEFSKYLFDYNTLDENGTEVFYDRRSQDRWGNFKPELDGLTYYPGGITSSANNYGLSNSDWPYAEQEEDLANQNASLWNLSTITLPSGGKINVEYEADDYAFVQDKRACQMFKLAGFDHEVPNSLVTLSDNLITGSPIVGSRVFNNYMVLKIDDEAVPTLSKEEFYQQYLKDLGDKIYFRALVNIKNASEFVPGYAEYEDYGMWFNGNSNNPANYAWIKLKGVGYDENESDNGTVSPIAKAAWQMARLQLPDLVYPGNAYGNDAREKLIKQLAGVFTKEIPRMIRGFNRSLAEEGYAKSTTPEKSWVRLMNPKLKKKGGGCRVSKLSLSDEWSTIKGSGSAADDSSYGQRYFYEEEVTLENGETISQSTGVATYEPLLGNDENPFKQPIGFNESRFLAPDNEHYIEKPIGESFYPSASVGYAKVTVADIKPDGITERTATGFQVNEFYTAKDFPFETKVNQGEVYKDKPSVINQILNFRSRDYVTASKGYSIILNDMHGKPKSTWAYGGYLPVANEKIDFTQSINENKISGMEYIYRTDAENKLDNNVDVVKADGSVEKSIVGIESDLALDFREHDSKTTNIAVDVNFDTWIFPLPFPVTIVVPTVWGSYGDQATRFRSAVTTKLINQHGLLKKVRAFDQGSIIETENLAYDAQTGEVLLSSVNNEFKKTGGDNNPLLSEDNLIYNMSYPAHWAYKGMQQASQNIGMKIKLTATANGEIALPNADKLFYPGDELSALGKFEYSIFFFNAPAKFWVKEVSATGLKLVNRQGELLTTSYKHRDNFDTEPDWDVTVVRSGYRNQQSQAIGGMASLENPIEKIFNGTTSGFDSLSHQAEDLKILDVSALEYDDDWDTYCGNNTRGNGVQPVELELCTECADVIFVVDISGSVNDMEFEYMKHDITTTIDQLALQAEGDFRYAIVYFDTKAKLIEEFSSDPNISSALVKPTTSFSTNLDTSLVLMEPWLSDSSKLLLRPNCGLNVAIFTDASSSEMNGEADDFEGSILLKDTHNAILSMVRYRTSTSGDSEGASVASPGWTYNGTVDQNFYDSDQKPRRFIGTQFGSIIPNIASELNCFDTIVYENVNLPIICGVNDGDVINPFVNGIKGNWRVKGNYSHNIVDRVQASVASFNGVGTFEKGYFSEFDQFWNKPTSGSLWTKDSSNYINGGEITIYNPYGESLEQKDALGNYSAVLIGYDKKLAIAAGANTQYQEMAFDGFEEYDFYADPSICHANYHMNLNASNSLSTTESHTGYYSFHLPAGQVSNKLFSIDCLLPNTNSYTQCPYEINKCEDCLTGFNPIYDTIPGADNRFVLDAWVKTTDDLATINIGVKPFMGTQVDYVFSPKNSAIDGWKRIYEVFEWEQNTDLFSVTFNNAAGNGDAYFDDLRIYPFEANMKSYVYHPSSLKLMAELDENNHASFYEYDQEWNLVRVKKETERGIVTLNENRQSQRIDRTN